MGMRPVFLAVLTCAVLGLAAFVTTTSDGAVWSSGSGMGVFEEEPDPDCPPAVTCRDAEGDPADQDQQLLFEVPAWVTWLGNIPLIALAVLLALLIARRLRLVRRRRRLRAPAHPRGRAPASPHSPTPEVGELGEELVRQAAALEDGEPRNAIVAAWVALEQAAARAGVHPDRAETPTEFAQRVATAYSLHQDALSLLADLYREARFSRHELTPAHIAQARQSLETLAHDLRAGAAR